jgi:hypothetical protein
LQQGFAVLFSLIFPEALLRHFLRRSLGRRTEAVAKGFEARHFTEIAGPKSPVN